MLYIELCSSSLYSYHYQLFSRFSQLSVPYLARASIKSATSGTIINVNGPDKTSDVGADLAQRLGQRGRYTLYVYNI